MVKTIMDGESTEKYAAIKNDPFEGDVATWKCLYKVGKTNEEKCSSRVLHHDDVNPGLCR